jgi:predicted Rossmann fold flavoprotein
MAAGRAAESGADVLLLEKMEHPGRKLAITGKGRCNLTNTTELPEFIEHFGKSGRFLHQAFHRFFTRDLMAFFETRGLPLTVERGRRVFPASGKAPDVVKTLLRWIRELGVKIRPASPVNSLILNRGRVTGVTCGNAEIAGDAVILATGGASYPATGSTGDGYVLARSAGHKIIPIRPALVPLTICGTDAMEMAGLTLRNVKVRMYVNGKKAGTHFGEMGFTSIGITGPVILGLSGAAVDALNKGHKVTLSVDLKPALDDAKLDARLLRDLSARSREPLNTLLRGLLPREMVPVCIRYLQIPPDKTGAYITADERKHLRIWLKNYRIDISDHRPLAEALITAGGVNTREIDPKTMASRFTQGLYIIGELLDIQADTGGYNLQAAFSTGWLAGQSAAAGKTN